MSGHEDYSTLNLLELLDKCSAAGYDIDDIESKEEALQLLKTASAPPETIDLDEFDADADVSEESAVGGTEYEMEVDPEKSVYGRLPDLSEMLARADSEAHGSNAPGTKAPKGKFKVSIQIETCLKCNDPVYFAEKVSADLSIFHKSCFRCEECNRVLQTTAYGKHNGKFYCLPHQRQLIAESLSSPRGAPVRLSDRMHLATRPRGGTAPARSSQQAVEVMSVGVRESTELSLTRTAQSNASSNASARSAANSSAASDRGSASFSTNARASTAAAPTKARSKRFHPCNRCQVGHAVAKVSMGDSPPEKLCRDCIRAIKDEKAMGAASTCDRCQKNGREARITLGDRAFYWCRACVEDVRKHGTKKARTASARTSQIDRTKSAAAIDNLKKRNKIERSASAGMVSPRGPKLCDECGRRPRAAKVLDTFTGETRKLCTQCTLDAQKRESGGAVNCQRCAKNPVAARVSHGDTTLLLCRPCAKEHLGDSGLSSPRAATAVASGRPASPRASPNTMCEKCGESRVAARIKCNALVLLLCKSCALKMQGK